MCKRDYYILCLLIILITGCSQNKGTSIVLQDAINLLDSQPDSALSILKQLEMPKEMPDEEYAKYSLLMSAAKDKNDSSLLTCDSLLTFALHFYSKNEKEKAIALLYKGRLEAEMRNVKSAIDYYQQALEILEDYPTEIKIRLLLYSSLGNAYFTTNLYDKAMEVFQKLYKLSSRNLERISALNNMSLYYCVKNNKDSALFMQRKALHYAIQSNDSNLITSSHHNLSLYFYQFDELDSAIYYARQALKTLNSQTKDWGNYYYNIGSLYLDESKVDSASYYLVQSLNTHSLSGKAETYRTLINIESSKGNYKKACDYLSKYLPLADSLNYTEQASEIERLAYKYNTKIQLKKEKWHSRKMLRRSIYASLTTCFIIIIVYQNRYHRKKCLQLSYKQSLVQAKDKLHNLQQVIDDNQLMITFLQREHKTLEQERDDRERKIKEREHIITCLKKEKLQLRSWLLAQSDIYKKAVSLSSQKVSDKKQLKVLTSPEQKLLQQTVFEIYADYISELRFAHPKLTDSDLLYLCLQQTPLDSLGMAICFGNSSTQVIYQRKLRLKDKFTI